MRLFLLIITSFILTGCFEIIEEVNISDNGNGKLSYTFNFSQSKSKINSLLLLDSIKGQKIPSENDVIQKVNEIISVLQSSEGISKVQKNLDFKEYIFKFNCDFENTGSLNKASAVIKEFYNFKDPYNNDDLHFSYIKKNQTFHRKGEYNGEADLTKVKEEDLALLKDANFTSIYRFEKEVLNFTNNDTRVSPNKKAVMLKLPVMDIVTKTKNIENTITLK